MRKNVLCLVSLLKAELSALFNQYVYFLCLPFCLKLLLEGLYRNDLLQQFLESWYNQKFLGTHCTFGDDRHLTNRMLSMGYGTK